MEFAWRLEAEDASTKKLPDLPQARPKKSTKPSYSSFKISINQIFKFLLIVLFWQLARYLFHS